MALEFFEHMIAMMERKPEDTPLAFEGDLPLKGQTVDKATYEITHDPLCGGYTVWVTAPIDEKTEVSDLVFRGSLNECKNYVYWNMEVE